MSAVETRRVDGQLAADDVTWVMDGRQHVMDATDVVGRIGAVDEAVSLVITDDQDTNVRVEEGNGGFVERLRLDAWLGNQSIDFMNKNQ